MGFVGADFKMGLFQRNVLELETGKLADTQSGLVGLDYAIHADIVFDRVGCRHGTRGGEDTGGSNLCGWGDTGGGELAMTPGD